MSGQRLVIVRALEDEPLRQGRTGPLYLYGGYYQALGPTNLTPEITHTVRFLSEIGATNVARRMGLTRFEVVEAPCAVWPLDLTTTP